MRKATIWVLAVIMSVTFLALLYLQSTYIKNIVSLREEQFFEIVQRCLYDVVTDVQQEETKQFLKENLESHYKELFLKPDKEDEQSYENVKE